MIADKGGGGLHRVEAAEVVDQHDFQRGLGGTRGGHQAGQQGAERGGGEKAGKAGQGNLLRRGDAGMLAPPALVRNAD
ncbi:hypothetical protein E2C06_03100 [Dankookia rubra]|uniref:Uncharacterized protein n=1 Tax=Dankookia rubra TaxID=1442381 RepID=A0A4R5QN93_9PROT|nr:hypothetical protein E2C06_03100 [Dankookia rubra]